MCQEHIMCQSPRTPLAVHLMLEDMPWWHLGFFLGLTLQQRLYSRTPFFQSTPLPGQCSQFFSLLVQLFSTRKDKLPSIMACMRVTSNCTMPLSAFKTPSLSNHNIRLSDIVRLAVILSGHKDDNNTSKKAPQCSSVACCDCQQPVRPDFTICSREEDVHKKRRIQTGECRGFLMFFASRNFFWLSDFCEQRARNKKQDSRLSWAKVKGKLPQKKLKNKWSPYAKTSMRRRKRSGRTSLFVPVRRTYVKEKKISNWWVPSFWYIFCKSHFFPGSVTFSWAARTQ